MRGLFQGKVRSHLPVTKEIRSLRPNTKTDINFGRAKICAKPHHIF